MIVHLFLPPVDLMSVVPHEPELNSRRATCNTIYDAIFSRQGTN